ncbi:transporter [Terriglobus sp. TAA 43]|uniref:SphA family protein n=1 Tax=Terriglobus sp. TAA 43 TaxID=278961 RepID=UPI0018DC8B05|nr:transporter [Terriglobus sp. TAA 43]
MTRNRVFATSVRTEARLAFLTTALAISLFVSCAGAQQVGHYIGGFTGLDNGTSAPPGFYAAGFGLVEPVSSIKGPNGNTVLKPDINVGGAIAAYSYISQKKILGGEYGVAFMVPVLNTRFNSNLFDKSAQSAGVSDILFEPVNLGWAKGAANYTLNYAFYAPTGDFDPSSPLNPGLGFWEHQVSGGMSISLDKKKLWNASALTIWEFNHSKLGEDLKPGPIFNGEYSFGHRFFKYQMNAGFVGYASQKLSADTGSAVSPLTRGYRDRGFGAGGEWKFTDIKHRLAYDVRFEQQYGMQLRTSGRIVVFSITYLKLTPPRPSK